MISNFSPLKVAALSLPLFLSTPTFADDSLLEWTNTSISLLSGSNFKVTGNNQNTVTFEHASGWSFGDLFMFFDTIDFRDNPNASSSWYGEISPRFSLNKLGLISLKEDGFIQDISFSTNFERGKNGVEALLVGGGIDFKVPGLNFFKLNIYARKDTSMEAGFDDAQITLVWNKSFSIGNQLFVFDGFLDYVIGWGPKASNLHSSPQIKWDMGNAFGLKPGKIYFGTEIDYWSNKFGLKNSPALETNQVSFNALLKVHF